MPLRKAFVVAAVLGGLLLCSVAYACNIPVFRYALERWRPDPYEVVVFHKGPLSAEDQKLVAELKKAAEDSKTPANVEALTVDLTGDVAEPMQKLWQSQKNASLPCMVLRYPASLGIEKPVWAGTLSQQNVQAVLQSPARREIVGRLLKGQSAVWVIIETGDKKADDATAELVQTELKKLEKSLKLPNQDDPQSDDGQPPVKLLSEVPLRVSFSVLRVARDDPAEKMLVAMFLNADEEVGKMKGVPVMFPIFGRGRALDAFAGKGINADNIESVAGFLCGACSCTVKRLSPGADLLVAANWEFILEGGASTPAEPPSKPGVPVPIPTGDTLTEKLTVLPAEKTAPAPGISPDRPPEPEQRSSVSHYVWIGGIALGLLVLVTGALTLRSRKQNGESAS